MSTASNSSSVFNARVAEVQGFYEGYYAQKGADRNSLYNPGVLFQVLAQDAAMIRALRSLQVDTSAARVLDIGCGNGSSLWLLLRMGFRPQNLHGVDIQQELIDEALANNPLMQFTRVDATRLPFEDGAFDLVMESMMFIHATNAELAENVASEMLRVTKPGGTLLISDWRYAKPRNPNYEAMTRKRIKNLFHTGTLTRIQRRYRGALLPPVGRVLSKHFPSAYFAVQKLFPLLAGHFVTVLDRM